MADKFCRRNKQRQRLTKQSLPSREAARAALNEDLPLEERFAAQSWRNCRAFVRHPHSQSLRADRPATWFPLKTSRIAA
jgi:hypothetical protein